MSIKALGIISDIAPKHSVTRISKMDVITCRLSNIDDIDEFEDGLFNLVDNVIADFSFHYDGETKTYTISLYGIY